MYHHTTSSTIPYLYITQLFQSALFLISTSPGHTSVSPYYQQYHSISVHHSVLPISPLSHLHITRPYQCITLLPAVPFCICTSLSSFNPLSHLNFTRPYQCIILLPAVPFHICTSLSSSNQPSFSSPLHQAIPVYHLTTSSTIPYLYITQSFQSALFLISTSTGHTSVSPYYQQYHSISVHHSVLPISPLSHLHITRPYQCITLLPAVPIRICTSLSSSNQPSFSSNLHQAIPVYHLTTSSTILYLYITQSFQSALFLISTSPGHTSISPYYQQYHFVSVHHSALPISPLSHLHITRPYQCITLLPAVPFCICTSLSSFRPLSHLNFTRPYQCITLLPAVPFHICTSLSPSNQPSFSSPHHQAIPVYHLTTSSTILYLYITQLFQPSFSSKLHQAIPVYHLTTSSTIPYLYITQSFQSALFHHLHITRPYQCITLLPAVPFHISTSLSSFIHFSHLHFTRPYQCIILLPAVPFHICTSLRSSNQPSFSSPLHQAIPVYHLTTSSTIPYLYITQLFQPFFSSPLHQAIPVYHLTTSSTIPYLYITQLFQSALFLISTSPGHTSVSPYYQQYHSVSVHHSVLPISPLSHLHITRPYQCITLLPAVPFHICTSLSPSNQPSFSSPHHQAIPVYHLTTSSTILYLYITQSFQSALFLISTSPGHTSVSPYYQQYHSISVHHSVLPISPLSHLHITRPYQCITLLPAVPFCICTSLNPSNQPSFSSPLHQAIPVYHLTTSSTIPYLYITQLFQSALFLISTSPGHTSVSPYYQQYHSISVHHSVLPISPLSHLHITRPYQCITLLPAVPFCICTSLSSFNPLSHLNFTRPYQCIILLPAVPFHICTSLSSSNQPSFSSPLHQAIPVYHLTTSSTIPYLYITQSFQSALFLISTSPGHTSVSPYYQQYHSISVHHSVLPISPLSHLHITRPYQCITLLPAVPIRICTSLSSSNQPSFSSPLHQAIPVYHLTTSSTILYLYITQSFQSALFLISTSPGHTSVSPYYQQYHFVSVHHSALPISPLSHLHFTRPYQCITLLPAVPFCICTSLSSFRPLSHLNFTRPYQCITLLPAVPFHICTSLSPSNQPSFSSPHHQAIPVYHLTTSSTILYLYITQLFQPSFSSKLHQAIPVYHLTTSSTIPYLYITQSFQSALFHHLHITRPYQCITLLPAVPFHISTSLSSFIHFSHLHFTRPYQCIILLPAVPFHICTSLSSSNQPSFSSPLHQAIPVYHLTTSSTIPYLYITQLFQPFFSSPLHQAIPVYHLTTSSTIPYLYITQLFQSALFLISTSPGHTSVSPYYQQYHSVSVHHSVLPISPLSHLHITRPYQCITLLPAVPFHICTSLSPSNQPSFSSPHHQAIPVYHLTTSSTILYLYITQSFQSALFLISTSPGHTSVSPYYQQYHSVSVHHSALPISPLSHLHITRPYQCITLLPAVPFHICTSLSPSNQPSFSSPHHQAIPMYHLTTSSTNPYLYITQFFQSALFLI